MSDQDNQRVGKSGVFLVCVVLAFGMSLIYTLFGEPSPLSMIFETGIVGTILIFFGLWAIYKILKIADDDKEEMDRLIAKYLPMCRAQVEEWIPSEEELMREDLYRRRKAYADEHPGEGEWRNFNNPTYRACVYECRKKRAEKMARQLAKREIENRDFYS